MSETPFSRATGCRVSDALVYCGLQTLVVENESIRVVIFPQKGAEIYSIQYKEMDVDPLLHYRALQTPAPFPATLPTADGAFADVYDGGWQVMFPSGGGANSVMGADFGRHGEAALLPWRWQIVEDTPERVSVHFSVQMVRTPFLYERELTLETGKPELDFQERITNRGGEAFPFMWGHHPAFGAPFLDGSCVLDVPAACVEALRADTATARVPAGTRAAWPVIKDKKQQELDLRFIPEDGGHTADMLYLSALERGWYALTNRNLGLGFALIWDIEVFPVLWVWQEFGGSQGYPWFADTYALGLEPCTNYSPGGSGGLAEFVANGQARRLEPGEALSTELKALLYNSGGAGGVAHIAPSGRIEFRS